MTCQKKIWRSFGRMPKFSQNEIRQYEIYGWRVRTKPFCREIGPINRQVRSISWLRRCTARSRCAPMSAAAPASSSKRSASSIKPCARTICSGFSDPRNTVSAKMNPLLSRLPYHIKTVKKQLTSISEQNYSNGKYLVQIVSRRAVTFRRPPVGISRNCDRRSSGFSRRWIKPNSCSRSIHLSAVVGDA